MLVALHSTKTNDAMGMRDFSFGQDGVFMIPAEALSLKGIHPQVAGAFVTARGLSPSWPERFNQSFSRFLSRWDELAKMAPDTWWPPRIQNVAVIDKPWAVRPFYRPLAGACWVVYAQDFEEATGSVELGAYTLLHQERLHQRPDVGEAVLADLAYWLHCNEEEVTNFQEGARRPKRPGSDALRDVAATLPEIRRCYDDVIRPAPQGAKTRDVLGSTLRAPDEVTFDEHALLAKLRASSLADYETVRLALNEGEGEAMSVPEWLAKRRPRLVITGKDHSVLWCPGKGADTQAAQEQLGALSPALATSMIADLTEIEEVTERFFAMLPEGRSIQIHADSTEEADGVYVHHELGLLAYSLRQPGGDPTREVTPPYARLLLSARAAHEWGHVGADNGVLLSPLQITIDAHHAAIERALLPFLTKLPQNLGALVRAEGVSPNPHQAAHELCRQLLSRQDDLFANKIALQLTSATAMECYLRSNAPCHAEQALGPIAQLLRATHEYQYLNLALVRDPWRYYMATTRFFKIFIGSGWVTAQEVQALFGAVSDYFASFQRITN